MRLNEIGDKRYNQQPVNLIDEINQLKGQAHQSNSSPLSLQQNKSKTFLLLNE